MRHFTWKLEFFSNIFWMIVDKTCFRHDMDYEDFKYLIRRTSSDEVLRDKAFDTVENPKFDKY